MPNHTPFMVFSPKSCLKILIFSGVFNNGCVLILALLAMFTSYNIRRIACPFLKGTGKARLIAITHDISDTLNAQM
jgi:hypothetical protein